MNKSLILIKLLLLSLFMAISCVSEKNYPPKGYLPSKSVPSEKLEANYFWETQDKINSPYWKAASYVELTLSDLKTKKLYGDGYLNMTGTYNGISDFNQGNNANATIKAGYDDNFIYLLVEWKDTTADASYQSWLWNGPKDSKKTDSSTAWTSQGNQDNLSIVFETGEGGKKDVWRWSLAYSAPFDMALNLSAESTGELIYPEKVPYIRNSDNSNGRTGPKYEWNDKRQEVELKNGTVKILDPAYYLLDEFKTSLIGNAELGQVAFNVKADCKYCHGFNGNGEPEDDFNDGGALNGTFINKYTRQGLIDFISSQGHQGNGSQYWGRVKNNPADVENLIAFMRGTAGIPGHVLKYSDDLSDVSAISNIIVGGIVKKNTAYKVLFKRKLVSTNAGEISFDPKSTYAFSVQLSDNDEINYVGSANIELIFMGNEL